MPENTCLAPLLSKKEKKFLILWSNPSQETLKFNSSFGTNSYYLWTWNSFWDIIDWIYEDNDIVPSLIKDMKKGIKEKKFIEVNALQQAIMNKIGGCLWDIAKQAKTDCSSLNRFLEINEINDLADAFSEEEIKDLIVMVNWRWPAYTENRILYKWKPYQKNIIFLTCSSNSLPISKKNKMEEWKNIFMNNNLLLN